jgi:hypothetical protein
LIDAYYRDVIARMLADVERRIEFWRNELDRDRESVRWFKSLPVDEQRKQPDVIIGRQILKEYAIDVPVPERPVAASVYYLHDLPNAHIPEAEKELQCLEADRDPIVKLMKEENSFIWRKCLSQIFDCAIRQVPLSDDPTIEDLFRRWSSRVDGALRLEWTRFFKRSGVDASDVFRRITFFDADYRKSENIITVSPNVVIDTARSTITVDKSRQTLVVDDVFDEATNVDVGKERPPGLEQDIETILDSSQNASIKRDLIQELAYCNPTILDILLDRLFFSHGTPNALDGLRNEVWPEMYSSVESACI